MAWFCRHKWQLVAWGKFIYSRSRGEDYGYLDIVCTKCGKNKLLVFKGIMTPKKMNLICNAMKIKRIKAL